jgi:hypothetical protein
MDSNCKKKKQHKMAVRKEILYDSVEKYIQGRNTYQCKLKILYLNSRSLLHTLKKRATTVKNRSSRYNCNS